jgi:hypothetical protein
VYSATVHRSAVPAGIHPGLAAALAGAVDAAVIDAGGDPVSGLGPRGGAGHTAAVVSLVAGAGRAGEVVGYAVWVATADSAWRDCYMVAAPDGAFSEDGHSGAAVLKHGKVIGIVLGGAAAVAGCPAALSYVQDIDAITSRFGCMVIP